MAIMAERVFVVAVKIEAPNKGALDEATALLEKKLGWWPKRLSGLTVISTAVHRGA